MYGPPPAPGGGDREEKEWPGDPRVCVIVVNQNRAALLSRCLDSLRRQTFFPSEILVVDNASTG